MDQKTAIGLTGEPVPPSTARGATVSRNSQRFCSAATSGRVSDLLTLGLGQQRGRLLVVLIGEGLATALIVAGGRVEEARLRIVLLALATMFSQASSWAAAIDLAPGQAGALFGVMNTLAQVAGTISPVLTPAIAARYGWIAALDFAAAMAALAGVLWLFVNPERPVAA